MERLTPARAIRAAALCAALASAALAPSARASSARAGADAPRAARLRATAPVAQRSGDAEPAGSSAKVEPAPPRVAEVALVVPPAEPVAPLEALVAVSRGEPLAPRALRRTVQLLFQTGRFLNVVVRAVPVPPPAGARGEWVRLEVTCVPLRILTGVAIRNDGARVLGDDALRAATGLEVGAPFDAAELDAALGRVRDALARRGHRAAAVSASPRGDRSVSVEIHVLAGPPTPVRTLRLEGDSGPGPDVLLTGLRLRPGAPLDEDALAADVREVRRRLQVAGHRRARVGEPRVAVGVAGADVVLPVEAGPRVAIAFVGAQAVPTAALERELELPDDQPLDAPAIETGAERLRAYYVARGFADVRVEPEERRAGGTLAVIFHVEEGRAYRVGAVRVEGAHARPPAAIRERLRSLLDADGQTGGEGSEADEARAQLLTAPPGRARRTPPTVLAPSARWDAGAWEHAGQLVADDYRMDGYLEAAWLGAAVELDRRTGVADVTVRLREGPRTTIDSIAFDGNAAVSLAELARETRFAPADPLSYERIEETRVAILRRYLSRGHLYARVDVREELDRERHTAVVRYAITEGPVVRIGRIVVNGNRRTREDVVRRALAVREGEIYDPDAVARSQAALLRLNVFRSVGIRVQDPETPAETKDLAVEVSERPWQTLAPGIGFSLANGPRTFVEYGLPNISGRAVELTARAKVNYPVDPQLTDRLDTRCANDWQQQHPGKELPNGYGCPWWEVAEGRADLGVRNPRVDVLALPSSVRADLIGERLHRKAYDLTRVSGVAGLDLAVTDRASLSLQYEAEIDDITKNQDSGFLTQADLDRLRLDEGVTTLHSLRPSFALDFRDNAAHPHRGWFASATVEYARSVGEKGSKLLFGLIDGSEVHTNLAKVHGTLSGYLPVSPGSVIAVSVRGGQIFPLDDQSRTIIPKRFFLGGASSMRGYGEDEMLQEDVRRIYAAEAQHCATSLTGIGCTDRGRAILDGKIPTSEGGQAFVLVKGELRLQLRGSMEAGLFLDLGNLWYRPEAVRLTDLRANVGAGLRFATPIGPAAIDVGFNVSPDAAVNERTFAPHFTIGLF